MVQLDFKSFKQKALKDKVTKKEYDSLAMEFFLAEELIKARMKAKLTQEDVANIMHTSKSNISRLENAHAANLPTLKTLMKYAEAVGCQLKIKLEPAKNA